MGTSLTGTKPKDTYDSLIKVGDNGPISGTAKTLSDGLGNDLPISVSTSAVGIGTTTPSTSLEVVKNDAVTNDSSNALDITHTSSGTTANGFGVGLGFKTENSTYSTINELGRIEVIETDEVTLNDAMVFYTRTNNVLTERARFLPTGGLTFNGDTAAANALDDYEEGTFTATLKGSVSDPTTPVTTTATYTKIGRQVTITAQFNNVNTTGASGGVKVEGLPFTVGITGVGSAMSFNFDFAGGTSLSAYSTGTIVEFLTSVTNATWESLTHNAGSSRFLWFSLTYTV